jgi:hypothetical protein
MVSLEFRFICDAPDFQAISKNIVRAYGVEWLRKVYEIDRARGDFYSMWQSETCGTMPKVRVDIFDQIPYWDTEKVYFENARIFEQNITKSESPAYEREGCGRNNPPSIALIRGSLLSCKSKEGIFKILKAHLGAQHFKNGTNPSKWYDE